jgi:hypothetical protein
MGVTVREFSAEELAGMQATQESAMQDECVHLQYTSGSTDDYGFPMPTYSEASTYDCGFDPSAREEGMEGTEVAMMDAAVRLPLVAESAISATDRIKITKRFGMALVNPLTYDIVSLPERGPSGLVMNLRLVTDGSDA